MAKFKRSVQAIGFRPEQVSERNISQLQAYSDRIANALREERDAVISNRNRTADAMKENAQIEAQQSATNQKIQQQNLQTQFEEQTLLSKKALNDFEVKNAASNAFFTTVASLSTTAAKKLKEYERARNQKQYDNELAEMLMLGENSPKFKYIEAMLLDANAEELKANTELAQAQERGLDPAEADRYARTFAELSPGNQMGYLKILANKYNYFLTDQASADDTGSARDGQKAAVFAANTLKTFMDIQGITGRVTPALLQKSGFLTTTLEVNERYRRTADEAYRADYKADFSDNFNATLANLSPADGVNFIQTKWPELVRLYGKTGALDELEGLAKVINSEGDPLVPTASIMGAKIGPKGETFGEYWGKRREAIEIALAQGANAIHRLDTATQDREAYQLVDGAIIPSIEALLADAPPSEDFSILETAEREVLKKTGGVLPRNWIDYKSNILNENKQEAQAKSNQAMALLGTGEPANINKARELIYNISDPTLRKEAITTYNTVTNPIQLSSDNKKTLDKSISAISRELLNQSLEGGASNTALRLAGYIRIDAYNMYKEEFKNTRDEGLALANVQARLEQEKVKAKAGDEGARFRTATGKYNQTIFPGFEEEDKITQGQRDARLTSITNTVGSIGVSALHSPGLLSEKELRLASEASEQNVSLNQIATKEMVAIKKALQTQNKDVTFGEIYNAQIAAYNANNPDNPIRPVGISPMLQIMDYSHLPTLEAIANNATVVNVARGIAESSPNKNLLRDSSVLRGGSGNVAAFRAAIINQESGGNYSAVNPDSGALGIGQVMPENVGPWTERYLGRRLSTQQFLSDPKAQDAVVNGRFRDMLNDQAAAGYRGEEAIRRAAAVWYSGRGDLWNDSTPQYYNGREYPSIGKYTKTVYNAYLQQL